jgi:hypothetical protein
MDLISCRHPIMKRLLFATLAIFLALAAFADAEMSFSKTP